jgi:hypothetical protein
MLAYATVVRMALENNIAFSAWDDGGNYLIYFRAQRKWNDIKDILIYTYPESPSKLKISQPDNKKVILNWTNNTTKNDNIVVERKSGTEDFDTIAILEPAKNTFSDSLVVNNTTYYYRLQTNIGDTLTLMSYPISIKKIITAGVEISGYNDDLIIYPNPASENINISWPSVTGNVELSLIDNSGRVILTKKIERFENLKYYDFDIHNVPAGAYILKLSSQNTILSKKINIIK